MIEKSKAAIQTDDIQSATPDIDRTTSAAPSLVPSIVLVMVYALCVLLMVAPLSRILDPVIRLQLPFGAALAQVGAWLPMNLGLGNNAQAAQTNTSIVEAIALIFLSFIVYGLYALYITRLPSESRRYRDIRILLFAGATLAGLIFVFTPAMLSHDIIVYASYSRIVANYHANPYFVPLTAFPHDPFVPLNYWASSVAAYGPIWVLVCGLIGFIAGPQVAGYVLAFRIFALAAHLLNTWLVMRTLHSMGRTQRTITLGTLLYALNPLVLLESSLGGHNDVFMMTFVLIGVYLAVRAQKRDTLSSPAGYLPPLIAFTLAALVKFTMLPVIALFIVFIVWKALRSPATTNTTTSTQGKVQLNWERAYSAVLISGAAAIILALIFYGPFWIGHSVADIRTSFTSPPSSRFGENSIMLAIYHWAYANNLFSHSLRGKMLSFLGSRWLWDGINYVLVGTICILSALWLWRSTALHTFLLASLAVLGVLLIVTPWFFSWYVTWLVGLVAVALPVRESRIGRALVVAALAFSASAFFTYLFLYGYAPFGTWTGLVCLTTIAPPLLAFLITYLWWQPAKNLRHSASRNVQI
ncbi:MAG TPA: hypothetical protein VJO32_14735 [Ktedonobacteraceae bacterium]|nr:hypothetical protein [Ktedonobacteraceae bacterium]